MFILTGAWGTIKHHFPTADIKGCVFLWSQAVLRKVAKLGLKTAYDQKQSTRIFIRKILALPFLLSDYIRPAFLQLVQTSTSRVGVNCFEFFILITRISDKTRLLMKCALDNT